ncbi:MAG: NADH-quinone oxidoreductase subunit NuoF [Gammaproteobacteria bacterium]|nr:NADH-quinone oxidoreductase subunit NuoF [Gammaproteobacteria bacterium]
MSQILNAYQSLRDAAEGSKERVDFDQVICIQVGSATCENAAGANDVAEEFRKHIAATKRDDIVIKRVGCTGRCSCEPIVSIRMPGKDMVTYQKVNGDSAHKIFVEHVLEGKIVDELQMQCPTCQSVPMDNRLSDAQQHLQGQEVTDKFLSLYGNLPVYAKQARIALRNAGVTTPLDLNEYIRNLGFSSLAKVLENDSPAWVIAEMNASKLKGRGGAGFPIGKKWGFALTNEEKIRYMVCNADEGDPGAFMDRSMLESDPFSVIEGMIIAGFTIGAQQGYVYIRAEYPLAIERLEKAIAICRENNLLGKNILGSEYSFDIELRLGAGAFVCGEETALIHSIEGERGQPRVKPPFPAVSGLWGKPTIINNVETLANVPAVIAMGGAEFAKVGTELSGGTKVFALAGKITNTGLIEVPMGTTLREIIEEIGGGVPNGKKLKAVQTGGPAGGFIPADALDTVVDYNTLAAAGSIMGSGGMIVLDEDDCMVDVAKFYLTFSQDESCGKCTPCREGTKRMLEILERMTAGKGTMEDIDNLERLAKLVQKASLCGLGKAAPNPILSSLKHFREEFVAHVQDKTCAAKKCKALLRYEIDSDKCIGCTACAKKCPVACIKGERKEPHVIDQDTCIKCGQCFSVCRFGAVKKV